MTTKGKMQELSTGLKALVQMSGPEWVSNHVDNWLVEQEAQRSRIDPGWFHPSSLSDPCDARLAFDFLGVPKAKNERPQNIRILEHGHQRDGAWKRYCAESGLSVYPADEGDRPDCPGCGQEKAPMRHICIPELRIRGELDDILVHPMNQTQWVVDYKTKNKALYEKLQAPDREHAIQVHPYMVATAVHRCLILYECSDNKAVKLLEVPFSNEVWAGITARIERILDLLANEGTPVRTPGKWETSCPFYSMCSLAHFPSLVEKYREKQGLS